MNKANFVVNMLWNKKLIIFLFCFAAGIMAANAQVRILKGVVSKDHIHMHLEYPPKLSISEMVQRLKGHTSRKLQMEFPWLEKRYWGRHFWATGYGAWSTGNITDEMVQKYLEHHKDSANDTDGTIILEE